MDCTRILVQILILAFTNLYSKGQDTSMKHAQSCVGQKAFVSCGLLSEEKSVVRVREILYGQSPTCGQTQRHCVIGDVGFHPCTGVQSCVFNTPVKPITHCGKSNYLKVSYQCIKVSLLANICSTERRTKLQRGYLATPGYPARLSITPDRRCVTTIVQPRGWTIRVYLIDFGKSPPSSSSLPVSASREEEHQCQQEVTFRDILSREKGYLPQVSVCLRGSLGRDKLLYESASSVMQIAFFTTKNGVSADKMGAMFYFEGLGPGMKPSLVTKAPPPAPLPQPTLPTIPSPVRTRPTLPPPTVAPYQPLPPVPPLAPHRPMLVLPGPDIHPPAFNISTGLMHKHRTTVPPSFHITNTTDPLYTGFDVYYPNGNFTYFDDIVNDDYDTEDGGGDDKWASIVGGTMFGLAMMMLVSILLIMLIEKRRSRKRQETSAASKTSSIRHGSLPHLEAQTAPKVNGLSESERAKWEKRNLYKMHRASSHGTLSSDGEKYEGIYKKGRYWDRATETDTSDIEGDIRHQVYEEYTADLSESTTDPLPNTDSNGNITSDKNCNIPYGARKVGFHVEKEIEITRERMNSHNSYEAAVNVKNLHSNNKLTSSIEEINSAHTYDSVYRETNNNEANLRACTPTDSLTTVSNIDGHSSIYCSNNSMFASNASLGSLWEKRSKASTLASTPAPPEQGKCGKLKDRINKFEVQQDNAQEKQYEAAKAYWSKNKHKNPSNAKGKPQKEAPSTLPKPGAVKSSPVIKVKQSPTQKVRASPGSRSRSSPSSRARMSPSQRAIDAATRRASPKPSPSKSRSRSRSPHSARSGSSPRNSARKTGREEEKPGEYHQDPELSNYSIYYSRSDFKRSLPNFNKNASPRRPISKPPPPPTHPPPKPTTQKPCLKPKPGLQRGDPVSRSTEEIFHGKKDKSGKKSKKNGQSASTNSVYIYDGGASLGGSYRSLNSLDAIDQTAGQSNQQSKGNSHGDAHYESYGNSLHLKSDDDLEIVDNELYPQTEFDT